MGCSDKQHINDPGNEQWADLNLIGDEFPGQFNDPHLLLCMQHEIACYIPEHKK